MQAYSPTTSTGRLVGTAIMACKVTTLMLCVSALLLSDQAWAAGQYASEKLVGLFSAGCWEMQSSVESSLRY